MKYLKNTYQLLKFNFWVLLKFEIIFRIMSTLFFIPLITNGLKLIMKLTGYTYLTMENLKGFILNPLTIFFILFTIVFLTLITIFDIGTMLIIFDASYHKKKITLLESIKTSLNKCKKMLKLKNILVAFMLLFLIPILDIGVRTNIITIIKIPEFIQDYILKNNTLSIIALVVYIFLALLLIRWIFSIHYMVLEGKDFKEARKDSNKLSKGNKIKDVFRIALIELVITFFYFVFLFVGTFLIKIFKHTLVNFAVIESVVITLIVLSMAIIFVFFMILSNSIMYAIITASFYIHKEQKQEKTEKLEYSNKGKKKNLVSIVIIALILITLVSFGSFISYKYVTGQIDFIIKFEQKIEVTAHRGESTKHPENTMSAFKGAKEVGADWIELDVQQTKDRQIVVSHDLNLARVTGVNKDIIDMTYEEISKLDAGSLFSEEFKEEKIPLLEDVLKFARENNIKLNIELKPTGKEIDFERQVIELIKKYNFEDMCVVTSLVYNVIENTKKMDPNIQTLYVMTVAIGDITDLKHADSFSVEATNVNEELLSKVHNEGKKLFVWTVNTEENINDMIDLGVDNIITDNCSLCKELIEKRKNINIIEEILSYIIK